MFIQLETAVFLFFAESGDMQKATGTLRCPPIRRLRSIAFNENLANFLVSLDLSGDGTVDWVLDQIYDHFDGKLVDYNGKEIKIGNRFVDDDFGKDTRRRINAYKKRANRRFQQRLHSSMLDRVMWMHFAREIAHRFAEK